MIAPEGLSSEGLSRFPSNGGAVAWGLGSLGARSRLVGEVRESLVQQDDVQDQAAR